MIRLLTIVLLSMALSACDARPESSGTLSLFSGNSAAPALIDVQSIDLENFLAYEHDAEVQVARSDLERVYGAVSSVCANRPEGECTVMHSEITLGTYPSAFVQLRLSPGAALDLVSEIAKEGELIRRTTRVEDLAKPVVDTEKRSAMLARQLEALESLETQASQNIGDLIRIKTEIAAVLTDLETAQGEREYLRRRIDREILSLRLSTDYRRTFWGAIGDALSSFGSDLAEGIAQAITGVAFLLPWLLIGVPSLFLLRRLWRRAK